MSLHLYLYGNLLLLHKVHVHVLNLARNMCSK